MSGLLVNPSGNLLFQRNAVMNGRSRTHSMLEFEGTLSVKSILSGRGTWVTKDDRYPVDEGSYLILNEGQKYRLEIQSQEPVETFCVFLRPWFLRAVLDARSNPVKGLDEREAGPTPGFYERLSPHDGVVMPVLRRMAAHVRAKEADPLLEEDLLIGLAEALVVSHLGAKGQVGAIGAAKSSTREELYQRLGKARDFMLAHADRPIDLNAVAAAACLSPYHFHLLFRQAFGDTPHQFLTRYRLAKAKRLLARGLPVGDVCSAVGFESVASFCTLFKRHVGETPGAYAGR